MAEIDLTPTEEMAANAARGLELRRKHGKGGTEIGVARARDISNRKNLSPETVRRMHAFFSRHEKNKAGGEDDAGYIAWLLWGGDSGQSWAKRKVEQMDKGENQRSDTYKEIAQRLGSAAKMAMIPLGTMRRLKKHYDDYVAYLRRSDPKRKPMSFDDFVDEHKEYVENSPMFDPNQFSRPGAKAKMGRAEQVMRDGSVHLDFTAAKEWLSAAKDAELRYIVADSKSALNANPDGKKFNYYRDLVLEAMKELKKRGFSRPGAKAKMGNAEDVRSLLAQAEQMIWTAKRPEQKREVMELVKDAERMIDASMPSGFRMRLDRLKQRIASEFSRFGVKVKMAVAKDYDLAVTDSEYAALIAGDAVSKKIQGDSQYQITPEDRAIRERAKAAMQSAQARWDNWQKMWERATTDAERAAIEARATDAESKMRKYRVRTPKSRASRPGAKAKMGMSANEKAMLVAHWNAVSKLLKEARDRLFAAERAKDEAERLKAIKDIQHYSAQRDAATATLKREGLMSRPGAKAKMANHIRTVAEDKEASRRGLRRMIDQLESEWQSLNNQPSKAGRIPRMETIKKQIAGLEERLKSLSSRPGAKAKFAFKVGDRVHAGFGVAGGAGVIGTITKIEDGYAHIQGDASALDRYGPKTYKARLDRLTAPPKKAWESSKNAVREGEKVSAADDAVSRKIRKLMDEGKPQKQAVAIALDLERRGEL